MEIGFLIPTYILIISAYGWWLYSRIVWFDMYKNSDMVFYLWLAIIGYFHLCVIRTINSRYGYSKETFAVKNFWGQWTLNLLGFPLIFLDWKCARGFSFYLAQTWDRFWIILMFLKICAIASVWAVLGYYLDVHNNQKIVSVFFVICFTVIAFINHPWIMKIWFLMVYLVPFIIYIIAKIIIYPFTFCMCCCKCCRKKSEDSDAYDSRSNRSDVAHDGGEDEEHKAEYSEDINNLDSARDFDSKELKKSKTKKKTKSKSKSKSKSSSKSKKEDRSKNYISSDLEKQDQSMKNENLETNAPLEEEPNKKKKVKKSKKDKAEGAPKEDKIKEKEDDKNKIKKGDRDTKDLDSLNFFSRAWRCLKARYCVQCDRMIKVHHPEFQCNLGHILHVKCAKVKWIGNNVCPICVREPKNKPIEVTTHTRRIETPIEEEIEESEHAEIPMKPNMN